MATYDDRWFEIWYSSGGGEIYPAYVLFVTTDPHNRSQILVIDPFEKNEVVFRAHDYEAATEWLYEDEYNLAEGRHFPDDGWPLHLGPTALK